MKKALIIFNVVLLIACGSTKKITTPQQSDVARVASKYPGYTLADLNQGQALFQQNCNKCHAYKNPASKNEAEWNQIVPTMAGKLNSKEGKTVLDADQQQLIIKYLVTMGSK